MRERSIFTENNITSDKDMELSYSDTNERRVSFAINDDVAYIYPWSPTKFLLFGKYSEEQLKRRKHFHDSENVASILKKQKYEENIHDNNISTLNNFVDSCDSPKTLEEIIVEEISPSHPLLPSMAIFSPNNEKDIISNNPKEATPLKPIKKNKKSKKTLNSSFTLIGQGFSQNQKEEKYKELLPQLATARLSEALFGCIRQIDDNTVLTPLPKKYTRMPSIEGVDSCSNISIQARKPLIRTQISKRYALSETDLSNIQHLNEEDFHYNENKKARRPLPSIYDVYKKGRHNNKNYGKNNERVTASTSKIKQKPLNQHGVKTEKNNPITTTVLKSCKQEIVHNNNTMTNRENIIQLHFAKK